MALAAPIVDKDNPWPWLDPFNEDAQSYFHGRDEDTEALLRMVRGAPVTVLFGKSGLGKTSLLQAGLFPALRGARCLPVYVRLRYSADAGTLQQQLWEAFRAQCDASKVSYADSAEETAQVPGDFFWLYLHRRPLAVRDARGVALQPVFVIDQFEEHFTLGTRDHAHQQSLFAELGDLLENRIPQSITTLLQHDDAILNQHDLDTQAYKFLISLREDFLPDLELWCDEIPRLGPNRYRLMPMGRSQALEAIAKTGGTLVTDAKAAKIVDYLSRSDATPMPQRRGRKAVDSLVEPALLSLVCSGLNAKRLEASQSQLDTDNLDRQGGEIIEQFYDERLRTMPPTVHRLVERELITPDGVRLQYPVQSAITQSQVTQAQLDQLVSQRILRKESSGEAQRIELVHDRLAAVALQRRRLAEQREADLQRREVEQFAAAKRKARVYRWLATIAVVVLSIGTLLFYEVVRARNAAQKATAEAREAEALALKDRDAARAAQQQAESALADARRLATENKAYAAVINADPRLAQSVAAQESAKAIVYLQRPRGGDASLATGMREHLRSSGYDSPPIEEVNAAPQTLELRYFRDADHEEAVKLAELMKQWNYGDITPKKVQGYETRSRLKQLEIWLPQATNSTVATLVEQMNAPSGEARRQAIDTLWKQYRASPEAVAQVLNLYQPERIKTLTANGLYNGVYFLGNTDRRAWNPSLEKKAREAITAINALHPGPNTRTRVDELKALLDGLHPKTEK